MRIKSTKNQNALNALETIDIYENLIHVEKTYDNNPLNNMDVKQEIIKDYCDYYCDKNGILYPKDYIKEHYEETNTTL